MSYDATWAVVRAINKSQGRVTSEKIMSSNFEGLSGKIGFENGTLLQIPVFRIIKVVGKSYREMGFWSPKFSFSDKFIEHDGMKVGIVNGSAGLLPQMFWPGGLQTVPKGCACSAVEKPLNIGVPARGAFNQFVRVSYDQDLNRTFVSGFSIHVFEECVKYPPYELPNVFVPFYASYDDMLQQVYYKESPTY